MHPFKKALVGLLTIIPLAYISTWFFILGRTLTGNPVELSLPVQLFLRPFSLVALLTFFLVIGYLVELSKNTQLSKDWKITWAILILIAPPFVAPFYWARHILRGKNESAPTV